MTRSTVGHAATGRCASGARAIGTTLEHRLHELTKPAVAWRMEFGSVCEWDARLTERAPAVSRRTPNADRPAAPMGASSNALGGRLHCRLSAPLRFCEAKIKKKSEFHQDRW